MNVRAATITLFTSLLAIATNLATSEGGAYWYLPVAVGTVVLVVLALVDRQTHGGRFAQQAIVVAIVGFLAGLSSVGLAAINDSGIAFLVGSDNRLASVAISLAAALIAAALGATLPQTLRGGFGIETTAIFAVASVLVVSMIWSLSSLTSQANQNHNEQIALAEAVRQEELSRADQAVAQCREELLRAESDFVRLRDQITEIMVAEERERGSVGSIDYDLVSRERSLESAVAAAEQRCSDIVGERDVVYLNSRASQIEPKASSVAALNIALVALAALASLGSRPAAEYLGRSAETNGQLVDDPDREPEEPGPGDV